MPVVGETYRRWLAGCCPCCGGDIGDYVDGAGAVIEPAAIAELVRICGRCVAMEHLSRDPGLARAMLAAIALQDETPIADYVCG